MFIDPTLVFEGIKIFIGTYPYAALAFGFFFARESLFIPSMYMALAGKLDATTLVALMIVMTSLSDAVLYTLGRHVSEERLRGVVGQKISSMIDHMRELFVAKSLRTIFISRFVYGTRTAVQILAGAFKVPFAHYFIVNIIAITLFVGVLTALVTTFRVSVDMLLNGVYVAQMTLLGIVLVFLARAAFRGTINRWFS